LVGGGPEADCLGGDCENLPIIIIEIPEMNRESRNIAGSKVDVRDLKESKPKK
jgi:hypothetical protein